jgi:hypothetical protein
MILFRRKGQVDLAACLIQYSGRHDFAYNVSLARPTKPIQTAEYMPFESGV